MTEPSLATLARRVLTAAGVERGATLLAACSGGVDSQVLLDVLAHVARPARGPSHTAPPWFRLVACGIDHGLRPEAKAELGLVAALAEARGVVFRSVAVQVPAGSNLQARARDQRFAALRRVASEVGAAFIATGHHLDDRAETVLMRIFRGAPVQGLAVLAPKTQDLLRPLIHASRTQIEQHARRRQIPFAVDPSNQNRRFLRVRVREQVMPLLRSVDPRIVEHLVGLAESASGPGDSNFSSDLGTDRGPSSSEEPDSPACRGTSLASPSFEGSFEEALPDRTTAPSPHDRTPPDRTRSAAAHFDGGGVHATRNSRAPLARRVAPVKRKP